MSITRSIVLLALSLSVLSAAERGSVLIEHWRGIGGNLISDLTGRVSYPHHPNVTSVRSSFEGPTNWADDYGTRMRGWLHVDVTGAYRFWIAGDNQSELWLGTTPDSATKVRIARVPEWTASRQWEKFPEQASAEIILEAGRYYIEALHKEGTGGDNLAVAWEGPGWSRALIPGNHLSPVPVAIIAGGGDFVGSTTVTITSSVPGAVIRYTRDGSEPNASSPLYSGPFSIDHSTVVRAILALPDGSFSEMATRSFLLAGDGTGLTGLYYANQHLLGTAIERHDPRIAFNWGSGAPIPGMPADNFSVRWLGSLETRFDEPYTLIARTDDGVRVWLDGRLIIDSWIHRSATDSTHTFLAQAGRRYALRVETFEGKGVASAQLSWSSPSEPRQVIPASQLYPITGTDLTIPTASLVSPAFVEGSFVPGLQPTATVAGEPLAISLLSDLGFWLDVPLDAEAPVPVAVVTGSATAAGTIAWTPTPLDGPGSSVIRAGDSLLFAGVTAGSWVILTESGTERSESAIAAGELVPHRFARPGHYQVVAKNEAGEPVSERDITVVAVELPARLAAEVGHARPVTVPIFPAGTGEHVVLTGNDAGLLVVTPGAINAADIQIKAKPQRRGTPILVARLGGDHGPILATRTIDEFTRETNAGSKGIVNADTQRAERYLIMRPYIPDVWWNFDMFAHHATFAGGADFFRINTSGGPSTIGEDPFVQEFDPATGEIIGRFTFAIELPPGKRNACIRIWPSQVNSPEQIIGQSSSYNPCYCKVRVGQIEMCEGQVRELPVEVTEACPEVGKHPIGTTAGSTGDSPPPISGTKEVDCAKLGPVTGVMVGDPTHKVGDGIPIGKYTVWIGEAHFEDVVWIRKGDPSGDVRYDPARVNACPGDTKELKAQLGNTGNCEETFDWVVTSNGDPDVTLENTSGSVTLPPNSSTIITTTAKVNEDSPVGEETVTIRVTVRGQQVASASSFVEFAYTCDEEPTLELKEDGTTPDPELCEEGTVLFAVGVTPNNGFKSCGEGERIEVPMEIDTYTWTSNAQINGHPNGATASVTFPAPGVYTVKVKVTGKLTDPDETACSDPDPLEHTFTVTVHAWECSTPPVLLQGMANQSREVVCPGQPVTFSWLVQPIDGGRTCGVEPDVAAFPVPIRTNTQITVVGGDYDVINGVYRFYDEGEYRVTYRVSAAFEDPDDALYCDLPADAVHTFVVTVALPGIAINGNSDDSGPGAYVGANGDDDDGNDVIDAFDNGPVPGEDDLVEVTLENPFSNESGTVVLSGNLSWHYWFGFNLDFARVWADPQKSQRIHLPASWPAQAAPTTVYLEGIFPTLPGQLSLTLNYQDEDGGCSDTVRGTVFAVNISSPAGLYPGIFDAFSSHDGGSYHWNLRDHDGKGEWIHNRSAEAAQTGFRLNPPHDVLAPATPDEVNVAYELNGGRAVARLPVKRVTMDFTWSRQFAATVHAGPLTGGIDSSGLKLNRAELAFRHGVNRFRIGATAAPPDEPIIAVAALAGEKEVGNGRAVSKALVPAAAAAAAAAASQRFDADVFFKAPPGQPVNAEFAYQTSGGVFSASHLTLQEDARNRHHVEFDARGIPYAVGSFAVGRSSAGYSADGIRYETAHIDLHDLRPGFANRLQANYAPNASSGSVVLRRGPAHFVAASGADGSITSGEARFSTGASSARLGLGLERDLDLRLRGVGNEQSVGNLVVGPSGRIEGEVILKDGNTDIGRINVVDGTVTGGNFALTNERFSSSLVFGADQIRIADLAIRSPRGQATVHFEKTKNRFSGQLIDIGGGTNLANVSVDDDGLVEANLGFEVNPTNYVYINAGTDELRKARARFNPNATFDASCDITETTKAGHFRAVGSGYNIIDVRMNAAGMITGEVGLDNGTDEGFQVIRSDDGVMRGFVRDRDEESGTSRQIFIRKGVDGSSPRITDVVPDLNIGQTATFGYFTVPYTITKTAVGEYALGSENSTIIQTVGFVSYVAWQLTVNGKVEIKHTLPMPAIESSVHADCVFYNDGAFQGEITASGTWNGHHVSVNVTDPSRIAPTQFEVAYQRGTQLNGNIGVDTTGAGSGRFQATLEGLEINTAYTKEAGVTGTLVWKADGGTDSGTITFGDKGRKASFHAHVTPIPELVTTFGFDIAGVYHAKIVYNKDGKTVDITIEDDGTWLGKLAFATPLGQLTIQLKQDGDKASVALGLAGDGHSVSVNVSEDKHVVGQLALTSGTDSLSLQLGFNPGTGKLRANGVAVFKNFGGLGVDSRFGVEDDGEKASYFGEMVDPALPARRFAGFRLNKEGDLSEMRLGIGNLERYFEAKGRNAHEFGMSTFFDLGSVGLPESAGTVDAKWNRADGEDKLALTHTAQVEGKPLTNTLTWIPGGVASLILDWDDRYRAELSVGTQGVEQGKVRVNDELDSLSILLEAEYVRSSDQVSVKAVVEDPTPGLGLGITADLMLIGGEPRVATLKASGEVFADEVRLQAQAEAGWNLLNESGESKRASPNLRLNAQLALQGRLTPTLSLNVLSGAAILDDDPTANGLSLEGTVELGQVGSWQLKGSYRYVRPDSPNEDLRDEHSAALLFETKTGP